MRVFVNILVGHLILFVLGGIYAAILYVAQYHALTWISNTTWRWVASAFSPLILSIVVPLWFVLMHGLGSSFRNDTSV